MMRVLIVSPHFPPSNTADMQRVRSILPYLGEAGIEAEVLAVEPAQVAAPQDDWLAAELPGEVPVHRVKAMALSWGRIPGFGTLPFRALRPLRHRGDELLKVGRFDLIYFSTTQFGLHILGPEWKQRHGVPFAMDYQDPWVNDYYRDHPEIVPPGGRLKHGIASRINRRQEPHVLCECSGITSVSAAYPEQLARRYPWLDIRDQRSEIRGQGAGEGNSDSCIQSPSDRRTGQETRDEGQNESNRWHALPSLVLPFPGDVRDFERVKEEDIVQSVFDPNDGKRHWIYVGRGGADMALSVRSLFSSLANLRPLISDLRLHFIGTSYAAAGTGVKTIEPLAAEYGLQGIVHEHPDRIPYSETLRCLLDADALIVPGSDDPGYTASKIYPYLLAGKPLLAVFHEQSSVTDLVRHVGGGVVVGFSNGEKPETIGQRISGVAFDERGALKGVPLNQVAFAPYTAFNQALRLARFFRVCLGARSAR